MKCLVTAVSQEGRIVDYPFPGIRGRIHTFRSNPVNLDEAEDYLRATGMHDTLFCDEADVAAVVERMTQSFPGVDVCVYKVESIAQRAPGELKTKAITKDGVLPV